MEVMKYQDLQLDFGHDSQNTAELITKTELWKLWSS